MKKVWSLLSIDAYIHLKEKGFLTCTDRSLTLSVDLGWIEEAYNFMHKSMTDKGLTPEKPEQLPLWLWTKVNGIEGGKPDYFLENGESGILVELCLDEDTILESNFDLWCAALLGINLNKSWMDETESSRKEIIDSWKLVFEKNAVVDGYSDSNSDHQATCWKIDEDYILSEEAVNLTIAEVKKINLALGSHALKSTD